MGASGDHRFTEPVTAITLATPFAIATTEVTWDQWGLCVADAACPEVLSDHGWGKGPHPIMNMSFFEAQGYAAWLSGLTGQSYRLPTEAEWEYAARAGSDAAYWFGDDVGKGKVNCRKCGTQWSGKGSGPVASFDPNPWGVYDMHGNLWELTLDCWHPSLDGTPRDGSARMTPTPTDFAAKNPDSEGPCRDRVIKGGSWYYIPKLSRSAARARNDSRIQSYTVGFRVVRDLTAEEQIQFGVEAAADK